MTPCDLPSMRNNVDNDSHLRISTPDLKVYQQMLVDAHYCAQLIGNICFEKIKRI